VLRVAVVGVNGIGLAHLWALRTIEDATLAAVCDIDDARATTAAHAFDVPSFTLASTLFASGAADAVVIATPPGTHAELARGALHAGLHVYCEKPVAPTCDEGYALGALAREVDRVFQVGFQFRYHSGYAALRDAAARIGTLRRVDVVATNWFRAQQYFRASPWRATWRMAGGGVLMNQAVHQLDALIATVGMPARVRADVRRGRHDAEVEDDATAELEWANGARGRLVASLTEPAGGERIELVGDRGAVRLVDGYDVRVATHDPIDALITDCPDEFPAEDALTWEKCEAPRARSEAFDMMLAAHGEFAVAIAERRSPLVGADAGTKSVELANAIYLSALTGDEVALPLAPGAYPPVFEALASGRSILRL
jgi:predicted dehydrogenase